MLIAPVYEKGLPIVAQTWVPAFAGTWLDWWGQLAAQRRHDRDAKRWTWRRCRSMCVSRVHQLPVDPVRQFMAQPVTEPTKLKVYSGASGEFTMYEDDVSDRA